MKALKLLKKNGNTWQISTLTFDRKISTRSKEFNWMLNLGFVKGLHFFYGVKNLHTVKTIVHILFEVKSSQNIQFTT